MHLKKKNSFYLKRSAGSRELKRNANSEGLFVCQFFYQEPKQRLFIIKTSRREFFREILYKNIAIIAIQHGKFILLTPLAIFPMLLGESHSSPSGKFPYTY